SNDGWIANGGIRSRLIIGAGGHFCPVARLSGARISGAGTSAAGTSAAGTGHETPVVAQETEFAMDARELEECKVRGDMPEVYFCSDMKGYGWCFRKGNMLNIGLGRADPHQLSTHVAGFLRFLRSAGKISFDIRTLRGHAYLLYGTSTREIAGDRLLLIGDAAGLAYPQSGEGILPAIRSGIQAAKSIAGGGFTREQAEAYRVRIASWRQPGVARLIRYLPLQFSSAIARSLLRTRWFTREVVLKNWFLHSSSNGM
ncbi:MAG TPA: hypothetical protein VK419_00105, partial [Bryobacteraceae bacterium]|nr:hypothetical protein [Bryobacteraceae bacterium]